MPPAALNQAEAADVRNYQALPHLIGKYAQKRLNEKKQGLITKG